MNVVVSSVDGAAPVALQRANGVIPRADLDHPSLARIYDYFLGGSVHWAIDRAFAQLVDDQIPEFRSIVLAHRQFVGRAVRYLARLGVRQFVDIGSGLLSKNNTHQLADEVAPDSRVVYVDNEPVAVAHVELLLDEVGDPDRHAIIDGDLCEPDELWDDVLATGLIDLHEPVAVLMFSVLQLFQPDPDGGDHGARIVARYRELLPVGSYLGISHVTGEDVPPILKLKLCELKPLWDARCGGEVHSRSRAAIESLLGGLEILDPGVVWTPLWHPDDGECTVYAESPSESAVLAGIGRRLAVPRARR
jgi:hypothetical protein